MNPLSYILHKKEGYKLGTGAKRCNLSNLFFVDNLKLYAISLEQLLNFLKIVVEYSKDIGMSFGDSKCAYQCIQRGKRKEIGSPLRVDHLTVQEIKEGDNYKYLGTDESVGFDGPLNKERVIKEYRRRVNRIWRSELNAINKSIAHNSFAVPFITPTTGVLNWTKEEIRRLDVTTRKLLTTNGLFHQSSDMNRLYAKRKQGGRGLKSTEDLYECRSISLMEHLSEAAEGHELLSMVRKHEENGIVRLGREFKTRITELSESSNIVEGTKKIQKEVWIQKEAHGYHQKQIESQDNIDVTKSNNWLCIRFTSHIEGFICAMQEQEIDTRGLRKKREKDVTKKKSINSTCRICKSAEESLFHLLCSCSVLAPTLYLNVRHN